MYASLGSAEYQVGGQIIAQEPDRSNKSKL